MLEIVEIQIQKYVRRNVYGNTMSEIWEIIIDK